MLIPGCWSGWCYRRTPDRRCQVQRVATPRPPKEEGRGIINHDMIVHSILICHSNSLKPEYPTIMNPKPGFLWLYFIWAGLLFIMIYYVILCCLYWCGHDSWGNRHRLRLSSTVCVKCAVPTCICCVTGQTASAQKSIQTSQKREH